MQSTFAVPAVTRRPIAPGTRVVCDGFSYGEGTFDSFSDKFSCPDTHISSPGIVAVIVCAVAVF